MPRSRIPGGGGEIDSLQRIAFAEVSAGDKPSPMNLRQRQTQKVRDHQLVYYSFRRCDRLLASEYADKWSPFCEALTQNRTAGALVRLTTPIPPTEAEGTENRRIREFARTFYPELTRFLPDL